MKVVNKTPFTLTISDSDIEPNESKEYTEMMFNTLSIHSDAGSCIITTEYRKRSFRNFGRLVAKEGRNKDEHGIKIIFISSID